MPPKRRTPPDVGWAALEQWAAQYDLTCETSQSNLTKHDVPQGSLQTAVRFTLEELAQRAEGNAVEIRVPPFGAVQAVGGPKHRRGTPPAIIETDAQTWLELVTGRRQWAEACEDGSVSSSGVRADLADHLPLWTPQTWRGNTARY